MGCGGAQGVLHKLVWKLRDYFDITILTLFDKKFYELPADVKYQPLSPVKGIKGFIFGGYTVAYFNLKKLIDKEHPTIISFLEFSNFMNLSLNKDKAIISFRTCLDFFDGKGLLNWFYRGTIKSLYPKAKQIIVNCESNKQDLIQKLKIPADKIKVIYNPIDLSSIPKKAERIDDERRFISIGRLCKQKNFDLLIKSFKNLVIANPNNKLCIIGDGKEKDYLQSLINLHKLDDNIFLKGEIKDIYDALKKSDYFIFSSKAEGFPNVLIEAMAVGLPIITSDFPISAKEIIQNGQNGVLLSLDNYGTELCDVYLKLNELKQNKAGIEKFDISKVVGEWKKLIQENQTNQAKNQN